MVMRYMRRGASGGVLKYILFGLLGMAVGGLALSGSFTSGGVSNNDVARIGDKSISIREFDNTLRRAIANYNISAKQAYNLGIADEVLAGEIRSYFLQNESENLGLEISKEEIARKIAKIIKPLTKDGEDLQSTLQILLRRQGMSEKSFVAGIKREVSGDILTTAIKDAFAPNTDLLAKDLYIFQNHTRDIEIIIFPDSEIDTIKPATKEQLTRLYDAVKQTKYKIPEYRKVKIASFDINNVDNVKFEVSDEEVKEIYEENIENYEVGEQFILSQALVNDEKSAKDIYDLTQKGNDLKSAVIKVMGNDSKYLDNIPFTADVMLPELNEAFKTRELNKITPPIKTALGYHVVKLINILPPSTRPLSSVKSSIKNELLEIKKSDYLYDISTQFDEMLADAVSFDDIAKEIGNTKISEIDFIDNKGLNQQGVNGLPDYLNQEDREIAIETIFELESDMPSSMQEFGDKFIAFALLEKQEATFKPFDEVEKELSDMFIADQQRVENTQKIRKYIAELSTGGSTFKTIATDNKKQIKTIKNISLSGTLEKPLNEKVKPLIFKTNLGDYAAMDLDDSSAIFKVSGYSFPEIDNEAMEKISALQEGLKSELQNEALLVYLNSLSEEQPATINKRLLDKIYTEQDDAN